MANLRIVPPTMARLESATLFFTVDSPSYPNPASVKVIEQINARMNQQEQREHAVGVRAAVFSSIEDIVLDEPTRAVAIFDGRPHKHFSPIQIGGKMASPVWAANVLWGVVVNADEFLKNNSSRATNCANTSFALFCKRFDTEIERKLFPWGRPKKGQPGPSGIITIDKELMRTQQAALNSGPDLVKAIAHRDFASELPEGAKISWLRIPSDPLGYDGSMLNRIAHAMRSLEVASGKLVLTDISVRETVLAGVEIKDPRLVDVYIDPGVECFSVARPDVHWRDEEGVDVSENDEMPGGMPELVHIDRAYGMNQDRWAAFFDWLTAEGPLVFVVSHEWSECYISETTWLVEHLCSMDYDAHLVTTDQMDRLSIEEDAVRLDGNEVGTIWRQFPIFEVEGALAELVLASRRGAVRMVPEFAHFGNKAWFHVFADRKDWYRANMDPDDFALLENIIPDSFYVEDYRDFSCTVGKVAINGISSLRSLNQAQRDELVLKVGGASLKSARSYGVLIGSGIKPDEWSSWIDERLASGEPFLIQQRFHTGVISMPVWNVALDRAELFSCKVLMRPWFYGPDCTLASVHGVAVPSSVHKVHGMTSMAVVPVSIDKAA